MSTDVGIDRVAYVTCSVYGHLRVESEGHGISTHDLEQEFDDLCGRIGVSSRPCGHGEQRRGRYDCGATGNRARAASNANSLDGGLGVETLRVEGFARSCWKLEWCCEVRERRGA